MHELALHVRVHVAITQLSTILKYSIVYSKVEIFGTHQNLVQTSRTTTNTSALLPSRNELKAITFSKLACLPYFKRRRIYMFAGVTT